MEIKREIWTLSGTRNITNIAIHPGEVTPSRTSCYGWRTVVECSSSDVPFILSQPGHAGIVIDVTWQAMHHHVPALLAAGYSVCTRNKLVSVPGTDCSRMVGSPSFTESDVPCRWDVNAQSFAEIQAQCPDLRWGPDILPPYPKSAYDWEYDRWIVAAERARGL